MTDYDWPAIARACGWKCWGENGSLQRPSEAPDGMTFWSSVAPDYDIKDAHAALEAWKAKDQDNRRFHYHRARDEHNVMVEGWIGEYCGQLEVNEDSFCTAVCRALEAYGQQLKEVGDG